MTTAMSTKSPRSENKNAIYSKLQRDANKMKSLKSFLNKGKRSNQEATDEEMDFYINDYVANAQAKQELKSSRDAASVQNNGVSSRRQAGSRMMAATTGKNAPNDKLLRAESLQRVKTEGKPSNSLEPHLPRSSRRSLIDVPGNNQNTAAIAHNLPDK